MIILDSTFLIDLIRSQNSSSYKRAFEFFNKISERDKTISTTFVNVYELYKGAYKSRDVNLSLLKIDGVLNLFPVLSHSDDYYPLYGELSARLEARGTPIGKFDEMIAAIAIFHDAAIVTNNISDFSKIPGLEIISH
ncbi:MAG: type II toxin-antitoxin system VapC family toxin [Methanomicrobium sp.]|nr:type II toxin-antitoxin system VapC family toxin [Methanomicrobium sp.]